MKDYDFKGIINSIKEASPSHLALVSLIVFPIILKFWLESINQIFPEITENWKAFFVILILILFVICIIWIANENLQKNKLRIIRDKIITRLISNNWRSMSFESAKKVLGEDFPDEKIVATIEEFPKILGYVRIKNKTKNGEHKKDEKGKQLYKAGVGRINQIDN